MVGFLVWMPFLYYAFLASNNPSIYLEIGSGNSTKFARRSILDHGLRTKIISIDPVPRAYVDNLCDSVIRKPLEDVEHEVFDQLTENDILFCDSSHRTFQNSDVTVFFTEIIPLLQNGVIYGLHDICLPFDYPDLFLRKYWNEQYMLHAYLLGGAGGDEIILPISYISSYTETPKITALHSNFFSKGKLSEVAALGETKSGGCFWLKRNATQMQIE